MATIVVGVDKNKSPSEDIAFRNAVAKALEKAGHKVEKLERDPNAFATYSYENKAKGKIGIYLIAAGTYSIADFYYGAAKNGGSFKYAYFGIRGDLSVRPHNMSEFESSKVGADADCPDYLCAHIRGMTFPQMNNKLKDKCQIVFGKSGEAMGEALVKAIGGDTSSSSSSDSKQSSGSTCKEAVQKLLKHWDGEVECRIIGNRVYINKVREPQSNHSLVLQEGLNVFSDSVKITDVNPNTVNYLVVKWSEGKITIKDDELIKRFGTIKNEVEAVKKIIKTKTKKTTSSSSDDSGSGSDSGTDDAASSDDSGTDTGTGDDASADSTDSSGATEETETSVVDVPITKYKDALEFANTEWHKIKRDNGHTLECQVAGAPNWRVGEWAKVVLPSFGENGYMYITRASHSDDGGDWTCNLTLQDYPPGWGVEEVENNSDSDNSKKKSNVDDTIKQICDEISKFSYSNSCSDGNCIKSSKKGDCWALSDYIYNRLKSAGISAKIYQYVTGSSNQHRQVKYQDGSNWVMFPYSKSGIDHYFYTNSIPSGASVCKGG